MHKDDLVDILCKPATTRIPGNNVCSIQHQGRIRVPKSTNNPGDWGVRACRSFNMAPGWALPHLRTPRPVGCCRLEILTVRAILDGLTSLEVAGHPFLDPLATQAFLEPSSAQANTMAETVGEA